ncbi:Gfo/Idh/MocA family protein [Hoeflea prorocentri]|uniref:Gfo/Idh/MocA family oxidoreductase n=1 Tax=Hoeflea prorocentri TaxID=1922333 RepID=A0A9X3ZIL3_9HYPH|nr:Gfo/Idh/MocA family oxidoreductase [Hoeflea prorocentri]MCY6381961.1 Gfo/Idh/MocA family oxidoreductase [Hoeflea prorocentri]MDA5399761.1 Gfo/Idh/MocA family oxidoreductase [Hoeflea prorocentri]
MTQNFRQHWPKATDPKPIVIFGAGSIVTDAHLPAYARAGYRVAGVFDPDLDKTRDLAMAHGIAAYGSPQEAASAGDVVFDLATPPAAIANILEILPEGSAVLIQKPMGSDLEEATEILQICRRRKLKAAVNFQLRFAPITLALQDAIERGLLGDIVDFDAWLALDTPWGLWKFLEPLPRVEISLHSIHYLDLIRGLLGDPKGIHAKTLGHPSSKIAQTRTAAILDYGDELRCALSINHNHAFGRKYQACEFRICGTRGAAYLQLGVNLDYPKGEADILEINTGDGWETVTLSGTWFPDAFASRMSQLQRFASGEDDTLIGSVEDAWSTMALVEAAYESSASEAHPIARRPQ